jgi:hypothetical protein
MRKGLWEEKMVYPLDDASRKFSYTHYYRNLSNCEIHDTKWLVYSNKSLGSLSHDGFRHGRHISAKLRGHEK